MVVPLIGAIAQRKFEKYFLPAICLTALLPGVVRTVQFTVDYEGGDCGKSYTVGNLDIFYLIAKPRPDLDTGRDACYNLFIGKDNLKLKFYIKAVQFSSCGLFVNVFDGDVRMNLDPSWTYGCRSSKQEAHTTLSSELIIRLDKPVSDSSNLYNFEIYVTNEKGPPIDLEDLKDPGMDGGVSGGVIAGIAVGAAIVIIIIVVIIIVVAYRWMKKKEKEHKPYKTQSVFSTTSSKSVGEPNGILKRNDSKGRGSKRRENRPRYEYDNKAYRSSVDGDSVGVHGMPDRARDFDGEETSSRNRRRDDDVESNSRSRDGRGSVGRSRRRDNDRSDARSTSTDDTLTTGSVFTNRGFDDDERSPRGRTASRDLFREENESWTSGKVSYRTDTSRRSDSPSRDSRGSQSSTTDGTSSYEPRFSKHDAVKGQRPRSHSRSSTRSHNERRKRRESESTDGGSSRPRVPRTHGHSGHGSHRSRSRSRDRQKKPSPYIDIWDEEKKKQKSKRK